MKRLIYILPLLSMLFLSCENYYLEHQLGYETTITDVRTFAYTLTDGDYSAIASNATNKATALTMGKDETDSTIYFLLQNLSTNKYFADTLIAPDVFIPAFLAAKYPQLSAGTLCDVTYRTVQDKPIYQNEFQVIRDFNPPTPFTSYDEIVPSLDANVHALIKREGYKFLINFSDDEVLIYTYSNGEFSLFTTDAVTLYVLTRNDYKSIGADYLATPEHTLPIFLAQRFPYATEDTKYAVIYKGPARTNIIHEYVFDGKTWAPTADIADEVMSFEMKDQWKANISTYLNEPFLGHGQGNFVVQNVFLQDPLTYTWYYSATYGMCTSAFKDGASWKSNTWLVSPAVKLKKARRPQIVFDQAFNKADNFTEEAHVMVSTDYKGDVTTATWTELPWNTNEDGSLNVPPGTSWVFQTTGDIDLSAWKGQTIYIGFNYTTGENAEGIVVSGTWELKNLLVYEPEE